MNRKARGRRSIGLWPLLALLVLCGTAAGEEAVPPAEAAPPAETAERPVKRIKMTAENWEWTPHEIRVAAGTHLIIEIRSYDASHSFVLKELGIDVALPEGTVNTVEFDVDEPGKYRWKCGRPCGNGCPKMRGVVIVEEP